MSAKKLTTKKPPRKEIERRVVGINLRRSNRVGAPMCHVVYEVRWANGEVTFERGQTLYGSNFQIDPKTKKVPKNNRGDLYSKIEASALLADELEYACVEHDGYADQLYRGGGHQ